MSEAAQTTFSLKTEYSTPYGALIREDVVMGVSRYFIERWLPVLGTGPATVVNTLRQLDYRCHDEVITISGEALAREAAMSRRYLYTCLDSALDEGVCTPGIRPVSYATPPGKSPNKPTVTLSAWMIRSPLPTPITCSPC